MLKNLEELVRSGKFDQVEQQLKKLVVKRVPRAQALGLANIARRVNQPALALSILNPIVRAEPHALHPATELERIEYAENLRKLGAVNEASQILGEIDAAKYPQASFHLALCCFSTWRYADAIPHLRAYLAATSLTDYQKIVGRVNLAAALIHEASFDEAAPLLEGLRAETRAAGYNLLFGNSLELSAQLEIFRGAWADARRYLDEAAATLSSAGAVEALWVGKWKALAKSLEAARVQPELREIAARAREAGHWETVRDCEYHIARIERDHALLTHVFYGTPHEGYKNNLMKAAGSWFKSPETYVWKSGETCDFVLNVSSGEITGGGEALPIGQAHHRLLVLLSRDFFKPFPLVALFAQLFPDEYFNPLSSPTRVHQTVKRLRTWIRESKFPIAVVESGGSYRLQVLPGGALEIPRDPVPLDSREIQLKLTLKVLGSEPFSIRQAHQALGGSLSTSQRLLRWGVDRGLLDTYGAGPKTRYRAA